MGKDSVKKEKSSKKRKSEVGTEDGAGDVSMQADASMISAGDVSMAADDDSEQKKKKSKKDKDSGDVVDIPIEALSPIARPLAERKLMKKVLRTVKKASKSRHVKRGVKEVVKSIRKGDKGLVVMAGDITPMDVLSHIPLLAEEAGNAYIFVPSKELLGHASSTKRPTSCVMVCPGMKTKKGSKPIEGAEDYSEAYAEVLEEVKELNDSTVIEHNVQ